MNKAFVRDDEEGAGSDPLPDREISPHPNLVTHHGLKQIEATLGKLDNELEAARAADDRDAIARITRDIRYWTARQATAHVMAPPSNATRVQFGSTVTIVRNDGRKQTYRIVGEDEADPVKGTLSYVSPLAQALLDHEVGDEVRVANADAEIVAIK
jgi:transcription elongation GreA/GreB family factor